MAYGVFLRFEQKRAENPCKHWGSSFFYRLLSSRKIRQFPMGDCALKTVWEQSHVGSNPTPSAKKHTPRPKGARCAFLFFDYVF